VLNLGFLGALGMGFSLGLLGGGGSLLAVPILVYFFGLSGTHATFSSLFVVGTCAAIGVIPFARRGLVNAKLAVLFFLPSVLGVLFARRIVLPAIPEVMELNGISFSKSLLILLVFGVVMLAASASMIRGTAKQKAPSSEPSSPVRTTMVGMIVGAITGLVGAGGGFLIVPALVNGMALSMEKAIGTSLLIIALNSLSGFSGDWLSGSTVDWSLILPFTGVALLGVIGGTYLNTKIPGKKLKPAFGWFVLMLGIGMILKQISELGH
jgi:uncharacterized membrane protein YfcA